MPIRKFIVGYQKTDAKAKFVPVEICLKLREIMVAPFTKQDNQVCWNKNYFEKNNV